MSDVYVRDPENDLTYDSSTGSYILTSSLTSNYTLTIVPTPSDATVTLTAEGYTQSGNSITVPEGLTVIYSIVRPGYAQKRDSVVVDSDITLNITLDPAEVDIIDESTTVKELEVNSTVYDIVGKGILDQNTKTTQLEWFGTLDEYKALEEYSDYCTYYITDDLGISNEYDLGHLAEIINDFDVDAFKPEVDAIKNEAISDINEATSNSVEQLKNMGEAVNYTNITNCITEIPQDIKLELNDGVLTLKAGSKIYRPNGSYSLTTVDQTISTVTTVNGQACLFCAAISGALQNPVTISRCGSGASVPVDGTNYSAFLNTTSLTIHRYASNAWAEWTVALPLAIVTVSNGAISSIDHIFNGFGYLGSTVFALPGIKALAPNGRNADGTLNNIPIETTSVSLYTALSTLDGRTSLTLLYNGTTTNVSRYLGGFHIVDSLPTESKNWARYYIPTENYIYVYNSDYPDNRHYIKQYAIDMFAGTMETETTAPYKIKSLKPRNTFESLDVNIFQGYDYVVDWQAPTTDNNYTWYRKYKSGWVEQGGQYSAEVITLPIKMANTNYYVNAIAINNLSYYMRVVSRNTNTLNIQTSSPSWHAYIWEVSGMAA